MSSAVKLVLGVSTLAFAVGFAGCDSGSSDGGAAGAGIHPVAGSGNTPGQGGSTPGQGGASGTGGASGGADGSGVPLNPMDGFLPATSNPLGIQGYLISYADAVSTAGPPVMTSTLTGANACIAGVAALVDTTSDACKNMMFTPPATDCYGQYWGAAIALNLNQPPDTSVTPPVAGVAVPYDASQLVGFSFDINGDSMGGTVPAPKDIRFNVESATTQYCNIPAHQVKTGPNTFMFTDQVGACYNYKATNNPPNPTITADVQKSLIKISWQVVTNTSNSVPFGFCISNVRAILKPGAVVGAAGAGGASPGAGGASAGTGAGGASAGTGAGGASAGTGAGGASAGAGGASAGTGGTAGKAGTGG
ncbi:MAG: hypothetical protein WDO69_15110 [Pseudomonadota bacterium]